MTLKRFFDLYGRCGLRLTGLGCAMLAAAWLSAPVMAAEFSSGNTPGQAPGEESGVPGTVFSVLDGGAMAPDPVADRFVLLDVSGDGRVSWEEFHAVNEHISRQGFDLMDSGGDGFLSLEEWRIFYAGHGMGVPLSSSSRTLPAQPAMPPLVTPPTGPSSPAGPADATPSPAAPASPSSPAPGVPSVPSWGSPSVPLVMPPSGAPEISVPSGPAAPLPPLVMPPSVREPAPVTPAPAVSGADKETS